MPFQGEVEEARGEGYDDGYSAMQVEADDALRQAVDRALAILEAIPEDNGADASTDRAIADAIKVLQDI